MGYQQVQANKEHAFQTIAKDLKSGEIGPAVALFGREQYLVNWSCGEIIRKYVNPACRELDMSVLEGENITPEKIREACETFTMMSEKRVVLVKNFGVLKGSRVKGFGESQEGELAEYIKNLPESCMLVMTADTADKRKKLFKAIQANGNAYDFDTLGDAALKAFVEKRIRNAGKSARPSVINEIIQRSGYFNKETEYTLYNLENDLKKLTAYSSGSEITAADVRETVSQNLETTMFGMIDAISSGRKGEAYTILNSLLGSGESVYKMLGLLTSQFEIMLQVKELLEEGKNQKEIHGLLKIHEFRVKKAASFCGRYSSKDLRKILVKIYDIDKNIKTGLLGSTLAMEMFISQV